MFLRMRVPPSPGRLVFGRGEPFDRFLIFDEEGFTQ
jgi:hypothetical protein